MRHGILAVSIFIAFTAIAHTPAMAQSDAQKAQERYNKYKQQQQDQSDADTRENARARSIEAQIAAFPAEIDSEERFRVLCRTALQSTDLSAASKGSITNACRNKLAFIAQKKAAQTDDDKERDSKVLFDELVAKLKAMPPTEETVRELRRLIDNNNYRLRNLSFSYQNSYYEQIAGRLSQIKNDVAENICAKLVASKLTIPATLKSAIIVDGLSGVSINQFLCGALVSTQKVAIATSGRSLEIRIDDISLQFGIVRYLDKQKMTVPVDSPIEGGTLALSLESAKVTGKDVAIGNPRAFVTNFYSQWTPQLGAYLAQQGQ